MNRVSLMVLAALFGMQNLLVNAQGGYDRQALASWFLGLNPEKVVYAINCGSNDDFTDMLGVTYKADNGYNGGVASEDGVSQQWILPNSDIYHSERYGANEGFKYFVPIPKQDGLYALILKFSEVYFQEPYQKIFDVKLGTKTIVKDLDIFGRVTSRAVPLDTFTEFQVKGGKVYYEGEEISSAVKNGKILIDFAVGKADNPKVNGILIVEGGLKNTHYQAHERYVKELDKIRKAQQQQHEEQPSDQTIAFTNTIDFYSDDEDVSQPKGFINSLLDQPYNLEAVSAGVLGLFFLLLKTFTSESENLPVGLGVANKIKRN
eukprot:403348568